MYRKNKWRPTRAPPECLSRPGQLTQKRQKVPSAWAIFPNFGPSKKSPLWTLAVGGRQRFFSHLLSGSKTIYSTPKQSWGWNYVLLVCKLPHVPTTLLVGISTLVLSGSLSTIFLPGQGCTIVTCICWRPCSDDYCGWLASVCMCVCVCVCVCI